MQIGFNLPISGPLSEPGIATRIAQEGEALGYDYLTLTDHIVLPNLKVPGYPYSESGEFFGEGPQRRHDQLTAAAFIAERQCVRRMENRVVGQLEDLPPERHPRRFKHLIGSTKKCATSKPKNRLPR